MYGLDGKLGETGNMSLVEEGMADMRTSPSVYVLESKHFGSNQQLHALASVLADGRIIRPLRCELRSRRPWAQALCRWVTVLQHTIGLPESMSKGLNHVLLKNAPAGLTANDIIIAKTPPFEWVAARLSVSSGARIYYLGATKRIPRNYVFKFISTPSTPDVSADIHLDIMPTPWRYSDLLEIRKRYSGHKNGVVWTLLIGGDARSYHYDDIFWRDLVAFVKFGLGNGIFWKISSSPRSGKVVESLFASLENEYGPSFIDFSPWSDLHRRKKTVDLLAMADAVFVTEESASMVSEAVNARVPVVALMPSESCYNAQVTPLLFHLEQLGLLVRRSPADLSLHVVSDWEKQGRHLLPACWSEEFSGQIADSQAS